MVDVWYMLVFGVLGYVFKKLDYPLAPLVLALVLGDLAENALRQSLIMSQGSVLIFATRPIAARSSPRRRSRCSCCPSSARCCGGRGRPSSAPRS